MPLSRLALALVLSVLLAGCVSNMDELKVKLGAADPPPVYLPPLARAAANATSALVEIPLRFTAEGSKDPQNLPLDYAWSFGDATIGQGADVTHSFEKAGEYRVRLTVSNEVGLVDDATLLVRIQPGDHKPVAVLDATPLHAKMGEKVAFDSARSRDADNDALSYAWDFGDGSIALTPQASHAYAAPGAFTARLRASDPSGASDEATTAILVDGAWRSTGSFGVGDSTAQSRSVPVVDGAKHLAATLSFPAGVTPLPAPNGRRARHGQRREARRHHHARVRPRRRQARARRRMDDRRRGRDVARGRGVDARRDRNALSLRPRAF